MTLDPYLTSYGMLVNTSKIRKELLNYLASTTLRNLNYEFQDYPNTKLIFITGCTQDEKDLTVFDHPIIIEYKGKNYVVSDIRKYVKQLQDQPISITENVRDLANATFVINRALFLLDFVDEKRGQYRLFYKSAITAYAEFMSYVANTAIPLTPAEFFAVKYVCAWFGYTLFLDSEDVDDSRDQIEAFLNTIKVGVRANKELAKSVMNAMKDIPYKPTIENLTDRIKAVMNPDKAKVISSNLLVNIISNMWYGHGGSETMVICLEHMPTWLSLIYVALANNNFKKTRLATILLKFNRDINITDYCKNIQLFTNGKTLGI